MAGGLWSQATLGGPASSTARYMRLEGGQSIPFVCHSVSHLENGQTMYPLYGAVLKIPINMYE